MKQAPAFAVELFEQRLQLSAVAIAAAIDSFDANGHSYPEDSEDQYPEETIGESVQVNQIDQPDSLTANAFPNTPVSPPIEPANDANVQPLLFSTPADVPAFNQQQNDGQTSTSLIDSEFAANTIPILLGEQLSDQDSKLDRIQASPENENSAISPQQDLSEYEAISSTPESADKTEEEADQSSDFSPVPSSEVNEFQPVAEPVPVAVQPVEESNMPAAPSDAAVSDLTVSDLTEVGVDEFFASEQQLYVGDRAGAMVLGLSLANKGFSNRKQRRQV